MLADVGLLGMPNAGKSTFIRTVSAARPKVGDYPFTTLQPHLGFVRIDINKGFVIADIPGLIAGAAEGAGLGHQFLRHLQRTKLLLHLVDIAPVAENASAVSAAKAVIDELRKYDESLFRKTRWLVLNKTDLIAEKEREKVVKQFMKEYRREIGAPQRSFAISALSGEGCSELVRAVMDHLSDSVEANSKAATPAVATAEQSDH